MSTAKAAQTAPGKGGGAKSQNKAAKRSAGRRGPARWTRHYQESWKERAANHDLPQWLRVACLAYGTHRANGHAPFPPGHLALALGRPDPETGELVPEINPGRAIAVAARYGFIHESSTTQCLVVRGHQIEGPDGDPNAPCGVHERRRSK